MDHQAGQQAVVLVSLMRDNMPMIPVSGTVTYTLLDHTGTPLVGHQAVAVDTTATTTELRLVMPADANVIDPARAFERRTILVNYESQFGPTQVTFRYRLLRTLNFTTSVQDVRNFLGINEHEMADDAIDLAKAYFEVEQDLLPVSLADLLVTGTIVEISAETCICMRAVLNVLPSVRQRIAQSEADGVRSFSRPTVAPLGELEAQAIARYRSARLTALGIEDTVTLAYMLVTNDVDPIIGG